MAAQKIPTFSRVRACVPRRMRLRSGALRKGTGTAEPSKPSKAGSDSIEA